MEKLSDGKSDSLRSRGKSFLPRIHELFEIKVLCWLISQRPFKVF